MSSLVVFSLPDSPPFQVERVHVNLWCLEGLFGRSRFLLDVGVRIRTQSRSPEGFGVALPALTDATALTDITNDLLKLPVAQLVFGGPVTLAGTRLSFGGEQMRLAPIDMDSSTLDRTGRDFSSWELRFLSPSAKDEVTYTRVRFRLGDPGALWRWEDPGIWRVGALVDVRLADLRDSRHLAPYSGRVLSADRVGYFVVAPPRLHLQHASPELRYARVLEGRSWEEYLHCATDLRRSTKLLIYHWSDASVGVVPDDVEGAEDHPFRGFLDLGQRSRLATTRSAASVILAAGVAVALLADPEALRQSLLVQTAKDLWGAAWAWVLATGFIGCGGLILSRIARVRESLPKARRALRRFEDWVYTTRV